MKTNEFTEGNKLIAEFMGGVPYNNKTPEVISNNGMIYHLSWDWLMPVLDKISKLPNHLYPNGLFSKLVRVTVDLSSNTTEIVDVYDASNPFEDECEMPRCPYIQEYNENIVMSSWLACVSFIKWYNQNK